MAGFPSREKRVPTLSPPYFRMTRLGTGSLAAAAFVTALSGKGSAAPVRDIGDALWEIDHANDAGGKPSTEIVQDSRPLNALWLLIAATMLVIAAGAVVWRLKPITPHPLRQFELPAIPGISAITLSPDGSMLAYIAEGHLYARSLEATRPKDLGALPKTQQSDSPITSVVFWSPDSKDWLRHRWLSPKYSRRRWPVVLNLQATRYGRSFECGLASRRKHRVFGLAGTVFTKSMPEAARLKFICRLTRPRRSISTKFQRCRTTGSFS